MNIKNISKEELETMGYDEIAYLILENNKKKMKLYDLFKKVCDALELPVETVEERIADFFELLSINKKFVLLKNGYWDLATNHVQDIVIEDDYDMSNEEFEENEEETDEGSSEEENEDIFYDNNLDDNDEDDDDLKDLIIIDEDENIQE